jgi:hypothetical protein
MLKRNPRAFSTSVHLKGLSLRLKFTENPLKMEEHV